MLDTGCKLYCKSKKKKTLKLTAYFINTFVKGNAMPKKILKKSVVTCERGSEVAGEEVQMQSNQAVMQGSPHFPNTLR